MWINTIHACCMFQRLTCYRFHWSNNTSKATQLHSWLRHCATSRKVTGSISDGVIEILHWYNPSCLTMPGVDSASNINEYQEFYLGGKGGQSLWLTTWPLSGAECLEIWEPQPPENLRAFPWIARNSWYVRTGIALYLIIFVYLASLVV